MQVETNTERWHEARQKRITASRVGAILGVNPWRSAEDVMKLMLGESKRESNEILQYGIDNEQNSLNSYSLATFNTVHPADFVTHPDHDWLGATPDGLIGDDCVLEAKTPWRIARFGKGELKSIHEYPHYYAQVQYQMYCTGRSLAHFYQWAPSQEKLETVSFDPEYIKETLPKLEAFYKAYLMAKEKGLSATDAVLAYTHPDLDVVKFKELVASIDTLDEDLKVLKKLSKSIDGQKKEILAELAEISSHQTVEFDGRAFRRVESSGQVDYGKLLKDICKEHKIEVDEEEYRGNGSVRFQLY